MSEFEYLERPVYFPLHEDERRSHPDLPTRVLFDVIEPHEAQAAKNHRRTLARLALNGGLDLREFYAVMNDVQHAPTHLSEGEFVHYWQQAVEFGESIRRRRALAIERRGE